MSRVVEHLAELTGFRDRELVEVTLVGALKDLLQPQSVAIYHSVDEGGRQHWLTRARQGQGETTATGDPLWADLASLPLLDDHPERLACLRQERLLIVPGPPAVACFPLVSDHRTVGVLELATEQPLSSEQVRMVSGFLRVCRNFEAVLHESERDTLTGLLNRKTFDESFLSVATAVVPPLPAAAAAGARRPRANDSAWLGVIDIDHFKSVNDRFGHLIGDEVLLLLARLMRNSFRFQDRLYRFGGEEFVVLMRCDDARDAAVALQRLRTTVAAHPFPQVGHITVSVGYTLLRAGDSPGVAFDRADKAVYYAKQNGRNQIADHAALVAAGVLAEAPQPGSIVDLF